MFFRNPILDHSYHSIISCPLTLPKWTKIPQKVYNLKECRFCFSKNVDFKPQKQVNIMRKLLKQIYIFAIFPVLAPLYASHKNSSLPNDITYLPTSTLQFFGSIIWFVGCCLVDLNLTENHHGNNQPFPLLGTSSSKNKDMEQK